MMPKLHQYRGSDAIGRNSVCYMRYFQPFYTIYCVSNNAKNS